MRKNSAQSSIVAHTSIREWPHILASVLRMDCTHVIMCAQCMHELHSYAHAMGCTAYIPELLECRVTTDSLKLPPCNNISTVSPLVALGVAGTEKNKSPRVFMRKHGMYNGAWANSVVPLWRCPLKWKLGLS